MITLKELILTLKDDDLEEFKKFLEQRYKEADKRKDMVEQIFLRKLIDIVETEKHLRRRKRKNARWVKIPIVGDEE